MVTRLYDPIRVFVSSPPTKVFPKGRSPKKDDRSGRWCSSLTGKF